MDDGRPKNKGGAPKGNKNAVGNRGNPHPVHKIKQGLYCRDGGVLYQNDPLKRRYLELKQLYKAQHGDMRRKRYRQRHQWHDKVI